MQWIMHMVLMALSIIYMTIWKNKFVNESTDCANIFIYHQNVHEPLHYMSWDFMGQLVLFIFIEIYATNAVVYMPAVYFGGTKIDSW
jgi:hypothetical protein